MSSSPITPAARRAVAIIGRPNVGKSAAFNRIAARRIAIVHDESGVTRDRVIREVAWGDARFDLIDTGGVRIADASMAPDSIEAGVIAQVDAALDEATVVILVVDGQAGFHPVDAEVAQRARKRGLPCFVAVNKCDVPEHDNAVSDFATLGFPLFPVSAAHNRGFEALLAPVVAHLPEGTNESVARPLKVAVVGRPNAGKSSYINRLLRSERVIVSPVAGTTRDSVEVPFTIGSGPQARHYLLIDTAGMRHVHSVNSAVERFSLFRAERSVAEADVVVLVMDSEIGPTVQDKHIAALIQTHQKGCVMLMNKWDLAQAKGITQTQAEPTLRGMMPFMDYCPLVFVSAREGYNVRGSIDVIDEVAAQVRVTLPTGLLNRVIGDAVERVQPASVQGRRLKIYYVTQTGSAPLSLRFFINDAKLVQKNYSDYLLHALRRRFGLLGAPVAMRFRERARPVDPAENGTRAVVPAERTVRAGHKPKRGGKRRPARGEES